MLDLRLERRRSSSPGRAAAIRWLRSLESLEERCLLSNGLVGVPAKITGPTHNITITQVVEDPGNTGSVHGSTVTVVGTVVNPLGGPVKETHATLMINAFVNPTNPADPTTGTAAGSVSWNVDTNAGTTGGGTTGTDGTVSGQSYFGQLPAWYAGTSAVPATNQNMAVFSLPVQLNSTITTAQTIEFQIQATFDPSLGISPASRTIVQTATGNPPLQGTFTIATAVTATSITTPQNPTNQPLSAVDVTFSQPIQISSFTTTALALANGTTNIPLSNVAITPVGGNGTTSNEFTVDLTPFTSSGGTATAGSYVLTVDASKVLDASGAAGSGTLASSPLVIDTTAPTINPLPPIAMTNKPVDAEDVTFSKPISATSPLTVANLVLTKNGTTVTTGQGGVTFPAGITVTQDTTNKALFHITGLSAYTQPSTTAGTNDTYKLTVNGTNVKDLAGNTATGSQSVTFVVAASPFIASISAPAPSTTAPPINVTFSDPVQANTFTTATLALQSITYDTNVTPLPPGTPISLTGSSVAINPAAGDTTGTLFTISGLQSVASAAGNYALTIDPSLSNTTTTAAAGSKAVLGAQTYYFSVTPANGVVGVAAAFKQSPTTTSPHHVLITSIVQDPNNTGFVNTTNVTFQGQVWRPGQSNFLPIPEPPDPAGSHYFIEIDAFVNGAMTPAKSIMWNTDTNTVTTTPSDTTSFIHQGTATQGLAGGPNYAFFGLTVPLQAGVTTPQNVTFVVQVSRNAPPGQPGATPGVAPFITWQDALTTTNNHPLTATLTVDTVAPTVQSITGIPALGNTAVDTADVTFSQPLDPTTPLTVANLTLTKNGTPVTLDPALVTITTTDNTTFHITGLSNYTTPPDPTAPGDTYVLMVDPTNLKDLAGNVGTTAGSKSSTFENLHDAADGVDRYDHASGLRGAHHPGGNHVLPAHQAGDVHDCQWQHHAGGPGGPVTLSDSMLSSTNNKDFLLNLITVTGAAGDYVLTIDPAGATDLAGNVAASAPRCSTSRSRSRRSRRRWRSRRFPPRAPRRSAR